MVQQLKDNTCHLLHFTRMSGPRACGVRVVRHESRTSLFVVYYVTQPKALRGRHWMDVRDDGDRICSIMIQISQTNGHGAEFTCVDSERSILFASLDLLSLIVDFET